MFSGSSGGSATSLLLQGKRKHKTSRMKDRANMSFFIVVMFFAVFGVIVLTEIFLIDDKTKSVTVRHSAIVSGKKSHDKLDYEDQVGNFIFFKSVTNISLPYRHFFLPVRFLPSDRIKIVDMYIYSSQIVLFDGNKHWFSIISRFFSKFHVNAIRNFLSTNICSVRYAPI